MKVDPTQIEGQDGRFWLTNGMARTAGVRLTDAVAEGRLGRDSLDQMVARCTRCTKTDRCILYLADPSEDGPLPDYCLNHEIIEALRPR